MDWLTLVSLVVAISFGLVNFRAIRKEHRDRERQIEDEWTREWAAQRPLVYPLALPEWALASEGTRYRRGNADLLPLKNGGRGPALNVTGSVTATLGVGATYEREIVAGTIAAGDLLDARVSGPGVHDWTRAEGVLLYRDLVGGGYQTRFECSLTEGRQLVVTTHEQEHTPP